MLLETEPKTGIPYTWDLAGSRGANFILYPTSDHSPELIAQAKNNLRVNHDVVSVHVATAEDRDRLYKEEYFRAPRTVPLRWYQIEQDEKLIRRERLKGTTPTEFVERFVLPFIKQTEAKFLETYGEHIYTH